uniref:Uncharacterized protein n=1 Tax=Caenorhabditis tropicalis TaxID=1561998 RepID=A0A1I7U5T3_9PELO
MIRVSIRKEKIPPGSFRGGFCRQTFFHKDGLGENGTNDSQLVPSLDYTADVVGLRYLVRQFSSGLQYRMSASIVVEQEYSVTFWTKQMIWFSHFFNLRTVYISIDGGMIGK